MGILSDAMYLQVYTVGPDYAHAEARKSPALDGKVERDSEGKEIRYPVMLTAMEKLVARKVCVAFKVKGGPLVGRLCRSRRGAGEGLWHEGEVGGVKLRRKRGPLVLIFPSSPCSKQFVVLISSVPMVTPLCVMSMASVLSRIQ